MAKRRSGGGGEEKGNWLDTYADMVTLLLCFFVLLYSASSVDETKWQYIYQSFTSSGTYVNPFVMPQIQTATPNRLRTLRTAALQANRQRAFPPISTSFTAF